MTTHTPYVINSVDDAFILLDKALNNELEHYDLKINQIDAFSMHLIGDKFHQTITPSVMQGFLDLQKAIYRSYAMIKYDEASINKLTKEEKQQLEIKVKVVNGSSGFQFNWDSVLNQLPILLNKMSGQQVFILTLVVIILLAGGSVLKTFLSNRKEVRLAEIEHENNKLEKEERLETIQILSSGGITPQQQKILSKAIAEIPAAQSIREEAERATYSLLKNSQSADIIQFEHANVEMSGEAGKELTATLAHKWEPVRLDGVYYITNVDSSNTQKRKIRVRNAETHHEFLAILENDTLDQRNLTVIQDAEWGYTPIHLTIKAKQLNEQIKEAYIIKTKKI